MQKKTSNQTKHLLENAIKRRQKAQPDRHIEEYQQKQQINLFTGI